jgi:flagellar protein FlgJ
MDIDMIGSSMISGYTDNAVGSAQRASDDSFAQKLQAAVDNKDDKALMSACREFEAVMLNMMYKSMKATIIKSDLVEEDPGTEIFESMQDEQLMEIASKSGSFGLAEALYKQLSKKSSTGTVNVSNGTEQNKAAVENSEE